MIVKNATFQDIQPKYLYQRKSDGKVDVMIFGNYQEVEEDGIKSYVYDSYAKFTVDSNIITEEMIKDNPMRYFNYDTKNPSILERLETIENAFAEMAGEFYG